MADELKPTDLTARLVAQPSALIPGIPRFVFSVPKSWVLDEAPNALAVVRSPREIDGFWITAILSHDRVSYQADMKKVAELTWAKLQRESNDLHPKFERTVAFGANKVYLRGAEFTAKATGKALSQLHAIFYAPAAEGAKVLDLFQIVCTSPANLIDQVGPDFMEIIGSFRFL